MADSELTEGLRGVAAGLLTPFGDDLEISHGELEENARELYDRGLRTFLACANISEYHSLSHEERIAVTETATEALPSDACVLAGVGGSTKTAKALVSEYERIGVDAMMVMPPAHTYKHERGLLTYYRVLADASGPALVPYVRGYNPSLEFLVELTEIDNVAGVKYAIEDAVKLSRAQQRSPDDVVWVDGLAEPFAPQFFLSGAEGFTAGVSNFEPRLGLELRDALEAGDWDRARALRDAAVPFQNFRSERGQNNVFPGAISVPAVKYGLELAGLNGGPVREPIVELSDEDKRRAEELYNRLQSDLDRLLD
jgi:4-hydroxy-tetrahydrodipicolinate synthase